VYRARDTRLGRDVAIKVLPAEVAEAPERLARFRREAQLLAALNHPNIAAIHGLEEHEGRPFLVLELVEGEDLSQKLKRGAIPLDEALAIARQVAEALEEAHSKGIVHRDLKPGNVMVRDDGTVKVLDYGLAKVAEADSGASGEGGSQSPTLSRQATASGVLLGTASYMSPEQVRGKSVDKRADIWAFGCVLFEMLGGRKAFSGETVSETLAEILKGEPGWTHLPGNVSPALLKLIERCLSKDPKHRLRDIGDAWPALREAPEALPQVAAKGARALRLGVAASVLGSLLTALVAALVFRPEAPAPGPTRRFTLRLEKTPERFHGFALSSDGARLAYVDRIEGARKLLVRDLSGAADRVLQGTEDAAFPFFSPDGEWIGFVTLSDTQAGSERIGTLKKVSAGGGAPVTLQQSVLFAVWPNEGPIVYQSESEKLYRIPSIGGTPEPLDIDLASGGDGRWTLSDLSPDGEALLAVSTSGRAVVHPMRGGKPRTAVDAGVLFARFLPTGHIAYGDGGKLWAISFDTKRLQTIGAGVPLAEGARDRDWAFSADGTLVYGPEPKTRLVWVTRTGEEEPLPTEAANYLAVRLSPEGSRLALSYYAVGNPDIWIYEIARGTTARLTLDPANDWYPLWGRDGRNLIFVSSRVSPTGLFSKASDGSGADELLLTNSYFRWPSSWSRNGDGLVIEEDHPETESDIVMLSMDGTGALTGVIRDPFDQTNPQVSPDGNLIAYESNESGRIEVYLQRFPEPREKLQISTRGGTEPLWGKDSRELFFREGENVLSVPIRTEPLGAGEPRILFRGEYDLRPLRAYDYDRHSDRFLMMKLGDSEWDPKELHVVANWFEELKRLAPPP
jgi:serine/threonine-protein kinase